MTKEEAINHIKTVSKMAIDNGYTSDIVDASAMAIKALEQEPILDEIRAEILVLDDAEYDFEGYYKAVTDALQIIDKYKEREG